MVRILIDRDEKGEMHGRVAGKAPLLHERYRLWAEGAGESAIAETLFGRRLKDGGFSKAHRRYGTVHGGIVLRAEDGTSVGRLAVRRVVTAVVWEILHPVRTRTVFEKILSPPVTDPTAVTDPERRRWYPISRAAPRVEGWHAGNSDSGEKQVDRLIRATRRLFSIAAPGR